MARLDDAVAFCDAILSPGAFQDYPGSHNGLQVSNGGTLRRLGAAVDANALTIAGAIGEGVDLLLVHHGLFWGNALPFTGPRRELYAALLGSNLAVYSSHLPLDCHRELGNNAALLRILQLEHLGDVAVDRGFFLPLARAERPRDLFRGQILHHFPGARCLEFGPGEVRRVLVCSGAGGATIASMATGDFDAVLTGEAPRHFFDFACANCINAYVCGHYATEIFGVQNLARAVAAQFSLPWTWIGEDCPL
ncbi:MAG: Nif3-like dinuclear metal center hexameric protein [Puniceicoccales bacterium]|jgi:dinuclear metal center YbgI/SA1388 family protein|nr:Nif3-like dinuclear metal center hexameric protein [Puniceicoccales bacterium]